MYISVGFCRTAQARAKFPQDTDGELIEEVGLGDKGIERGWTHGSVVAARFCLFFTYFMFLASANLAAVLNVKKLADPLIAKLLPMTPTSSR